MILAIDAGNTNIVLGGTENGKITFLSRISTDIQKTQDEYAINIRNILLLHNADPAAVDGAIISSVVPPLTASLQGAVETITGKKPMVVGPGTKTGLNILIDNPAQLGADLVAGAVAAIHKYPLPLVIIDMGTATTFSVVDKSSNMVGGFIYPGIRVSHDALISRTSQLPRVSLEAPGRVIGKNTIECMQIGLVYGCAAMVDGMLDRIDDEIGVKTTVIATGGLAHTITPHCRREIICDDNLLLEGLMFIYDKNKKK